MNIEEQLKEKKGTLIQGLFEFLWSVNENLMLGERVGYYPGRIGHSEDYAKYFKDWTLEEFMYNIIHYIPQYIHLSPGNGAKIAKLTNEIFRVYYSLGVKFSVNYMSEYYDRFMSELKHLPIAEIEELYMKYNLGYIEYYLRTGSR
jgi:hypothetical protein